MVKRYLMLLLLIPGLLLIASCNSRHTAERPDTTIPAIVSTNPAANATAVSINTSISVTFSEAMNASTINANSFFVLKAATSTAPSITIAGTITYTATNNIATFTSLSALEHNTAYVAVATTEISDAAGNHLAAAYQWTFATIPAPGALDVSFGTGGRVRTSLSAGDDIVYATAIQTDGKIITAGLSAASTSPTATTYFTIARFLTNGSLDTNFNPPLLLGVNSYHTGRAQAVVLQVDGKIVAGGFAGGRAGLPGNSLIARFNSDGTRDTSYGSRPSPDDGSSVLDLGGAAVNYIRALAVQTDGQVVAAADATDDNGSHYRFALARINSSGSLDLSFGVTGTVVNTSYASAHAFLLKIQPNNGMILVGGTYKNVAEDAVGMVSSYLMRYDSAGVLDPSFGTGGIVTVSTGTNTSISGMDVLTSGKIVVAGTTTNTTSDLFLMRFNADGSSDTSFGTNGVTITDDADHGEQTAAGLVLQTDGKLVVGATFRPTTGPGVSNYDFSVFRYGENGILDATFGAGGTGIAVTDLGSNLEAPTSVLIQQDGKIILIGVAQGGTGYDVGLARYWP